MLKGNKLCTKGFLGAAATRNTAPYRQKERNPKFRSFGNNSLFITPKNPQDIQKCKRGMKR